MPPLCALREREGYWRPSGSRRVLSGPVKSHTLHAIVDSLPRMLESLQRLPPEFIWPLMLIWSFAFLIILHRLFGQGGVYVYIVVAILGANIQVLKTVKFSVYPSPVALGTILFSSTYLATDILVERYGAAAARRGVILGFLSYIFFTGAMLLTLAYAPLTPEQAGESMAGALPFHHHIEALFLPSPALLVAGMAAYLVSQFNDVWIFQRVRRATGGRFLWLRSNVSTGVAALIDNTVFSVLAWIVLAPQPLPFRTVLITYILGTYWLRLAISVLDTPFLYLARRWAPAQVVPAPVRVRRHRPGARPARPSRSADGHRTA